MKITLDISRLVEEGKLTREEVERMQISADEELVNRLTFERTECGAIPPQLRLRNEVQRRKRT